jgi:hypothetical protein
MKILCVVVGVDYRYEKFVLRKLHIFTVNIFSVKKKLLFSLFSSLKFI